MDLTVLGASSRYLSPLGAGTSYLVRHEGTNILLDCGNGTSIRLAHELGDDKLHGVVVSHFHVDNASDLFPVAFALPTGTPLLVPKGARPRLTDLLRAYSMDKTWIKNARIEGVGRGSTLQIGTLTIDFERAGHGCPGVATRIRTHNGTTLVYLSDTGPRPWLTPFAHNADLLIAHTLLLDRDAGRITRTNLTAGAAGRLARDARVRTLALSHIPFYAAADASHAEAKTASGGEVIVLREGQRMTVGGG